MEEKTAYDVHMHAFNLSHPSISAFLGRAIRELWRGLLTPRHAFRFVLFVLLGLALAALAVLVVATCLIPPLQLGARWLTRVIWYRLKRVLDAAANLLLVLENDIGSTFLLMEDCLREKENPLLRADGLHLGTECYSRVVLTPLMMDFGYKGRTPPHEEKPKRRFHYDVPAGKPIVEQVVDVFRAIRVYVETKSDPSLSVKYPSLDPTTERVFEIYPFLGLNPANYRPPKKLADLLEKYFGEYTGRREDLRKNLGQFDGDIDHLGNHAFAGIKVYPPLGFDPWPDSDGDALEKVELLYSKCCEKGIPLTTHGGKGGFVTVRRRVLDEIAEVSKWAEVLGAHSTLKLDIAHFPIGRSERERQSEMLALVLEHENVYVDISCRAFTDAYYQGLRTLLDRLPTPDAEKLTSRILFGSDFAVNLMWIESYNRYLSLFSQTTVLTQAEKHAFCSVNPKRFLFRT